MNKEGAAKFVRMLADLARTAANAPERPRWNDTSFFRRFAKGEGQGSTGSRP